MMNSAYDRWLTTNPDEDQWIWFCEQVAEAHTDKFYNNNEDWIEDDKSSYNKLLDKLASADYKPKKAALIIERIHSLYKL